MLKKTIKTQFTLGTAVILTLVCIGAALLEYGSMRQQVFDSVHKKTEIYLAAASATRAYVMETLRPRMIETMSPDTFIIEAMSSSYVSREVMVRLRSRFPEFRYKRAAGNPRNPINMADEFESRMLTWFQENLDADDWTGTVQINGDEYYAKLTPIIVEQSCLTCHGKPEDAPFELRDKYGDTASYGYRVGDVVAADTIYIPMKESLLKIKKRAWSLFILGFVSLLLLWAMFYLLFTRTVITQLRNLLMNVVTIFGEDKLQIMKVPEGVADEIGQLQAAFRNVAQNLKSAHDELTMSEQKYRRLFETSPESIFLCNAQLKPTNLNSAGMALFKFKDQSGVNAMESILTLFWDGRVAFELMYRLKKEGVLREEDVCVVDCEGNRINAVITASRLLDDSGRFAGMEMVLRDVTEKKKMEKKLAQTEKLAAIGQLAAGVAHEINNPLGVISCYAKLIKKSVPPRSQMAEDIEVIRKHTGSCKRVVDSLLNFSRADEPVMSKTDLVFLMEGVLLVFDHQAHSKGISLKRALSPGLPSITCDGNKLKQVFMNMILNAIQALDSGGEVKVSAFEENGEIIINITDNGPGIPGDKLKKIFDPFFTTKKAGKGTGLGLSVSYGIIEQHRGEIKVLSTPGQGTTFSIHLPLDEPCDSA